MAKFVFRLNSILNLKLKLEEQEKIAYSLAAARVREEEEKLRALIFKREELINNKRMLLSGMISAKELNLTENAIKSTDGKISEQTLILKKAEKNLDNARIKLNNAIKERKIYEKLKEHAYESWLKDLEHTEQLEINELVSFRHGTKQ